MHRLGHLVLSQHVPTDVSRQSMIDSRDKLHLTRHHPIHAHNFTVWSHSTAQIPCSCHGSACSDVSSRPPCFEIFVIEGHISTNFQIKSSFLCPTYQRDPGVPFSKKLARRNNATSLYIDVESSRSPAKSESWNRPNLQCDKIVDSRLFDESRKSNESVCHKLLSIS